MANPLENPKNASWMETPFTIRQVETHLVFGPISRHVPFGYVVLGAGLISLVGGFFAVGEPIGRYIGSILDKLFFAVAVPVILLRLSCRQQAIVGWLAIKFALGLAAFMVATIGAGVSFHRGHSDAWPMLFLGLIWIPGIEFIPRITPHQRYVTLARIVFSVPCIYFGIMSGHWHWN